MTKREAIESFVEKRFSAIPTEWVKVVSEHMVGVDNQYPRLPMWGTMWFIESIWGEKLYNEAKILEEYDENKNETWNEDNADEEMAGERNVLDKAGNRTAVYIYEIDGQYLIGVNGAGWSFYDGVWDMLYDLLGIQWHDTQDTIENLSNFNHKK